MNTQYSLNTILVTYESTKNAYFESGAYESRSENRIARRNEEGK
jgi:hypothetical protein